MVKSWWKRTMILLIAILIAAAFFCAWTSVNYSRQIRQTTARENTNSVTLWAELTSSRLNTLYEHIYELLLTLYNNTELRTGTPIMDQWTKLAILEMMEDKLLISDDADAFFVYDSQNEFFLFSAETNADARSILAVKEYVRSNAVATAEAFRIRNWRVVTIDGIHYFYKCVKLGKYTVGAVSDLRHYYIDNTFSVLGSEFSFRLLTDDKSFPCGGTELYEDADTVTVTGELALAGATAQLSVLPDGFWDDSLMVSTLLVLDSAICVVLVAVLLYLLRRDVAMPTKALLQANHALACGDTSYRLDPDKAGSQEFQVLYDSFNEMSQQIVQLRIQAYEQELREDANKLTMLRAQIKPHSFLNAITTISNMTYSNKPEEIRSYISSFARFIRYMLNVSSSWTTVDDEILQIRNYLKMQSLRFPGSVHFSVEQEEHTGSHPIPFLCLYTLVENSIKHAMTLYETLDIRIRCRRVDTESFRGICLIQEDSGAGFPQEVLDALQRDNPESLNTKEHLGLTNVRYTLNLVYRRSDLLRVSNREEGGAHVELWIPEQEANHETSHM